MLIPWRHAGVVTPRSFKKKHAFVHLVTKHPPWGKSNLGGKHNFEEREKSNTVGFKNNSNDHLQGGVSKKTIALGSVIKTQIWGKQRRTVEKITCSTLLRLLAWLQLHCQFSTIRKYGAGSDCFIYCKCFLKMAWQRPGKKSVPPSRLVDSSFGGVMKRSSLFESTHRSFWKVQGFPFENRIAHTNRGQYHARSFTPPPPIGLVSAIRTFLWEVWGGGLCGRWIWK